MLWPFAPGLTAPRPVQGEGADLGRERLGGVEHGGGEVRCRYNDDPCRAMWCIRRTAVGRVRRWRGGRSMLLSWIGMGGSSRYSAAGAFTERCLVRWDGFVVVGLVIGVDPLRSRLL